MPFALLNSLSHFTTLTRRDHSLFTDGKVEAEVVHWWGWLFAQLLMLWWWSPGLGSILLHNPLVGSGTRGSRAGGPQRPHPKFHPRHHETLPAETPFTLSFSRAGLFPY